jgi:hypothetical protein
VSLLGHAVQCHKFVETHNLRETPRMDTCTERNGDVHNFFFTHTARMYSVESGLEGASRGNILGVTGASLAKNKNGLKCGHPTPSSRWEIPSVGSSAEQCIRYPEGRKEREELSPCILASKYKALLTIKKRKVRRVKKGKRARYRRKSRETTAGPLAAAEDDNQNENSEPAGQRVLLWCMDVRSCDASGIEVRRPLLYLQRRASS